MIRYKSKGLSLNEFGRILAKAGLSKDGQGRPRLRPHCRKGSEELNQKLSYGVFVADSAETKDSPNKGSSKYL